MAKRRIQQRKRASGFQTDRDPSTRGGNLDSGILVLLSVYPWARVRLPRPGMLVGLDHDPIAQEGGPEQGN